MKRFLFRFKRLCAVTGVIALGLSSTAAMAETIVVNPKLAANDDRFDLSMELLVEALKRTEDRYGSVTVKRYREKVTRQRALSLLVKGDMDVFETATRQEWEAEAIPIRIPVRKGILGYKIFLINKGDQQKFADVESLEDLLTYRMGQGSQWSTTKALARLGIKTVGTKEYEPLFRMLAGRRFDYFPRGINEAFGELEARRDIYPNMAVEGSLALYIPLPTYFFVTPNKPELAKRIKAGLLSQLEDGTLDKVFMKYHGEDIRKANLHNRKLFVLENKNLSPETPFDRSDLWIDPTKKPTS